MNLIAGKPIFFLPPIEGIFENLKQLAKELTRPVIALNWMKTMQELRDIKKVSLYYKERLKQLVPEGHYDVVGHSFGAVIGIHMCRKQVPMDTFIILDPSDHEIKEENQDERYVFFVFYIKIKNLI